MTLALHRSLIFWSGLMVIGFIVWAWRDSRLHSSSIENAKTEVHHVYSGILVKTCPRCTPQKWGGLRLPTGGDHRSKVIFPRALWLKGGGPRRRASPDELARIKTYEQHIFHNNSFAPPDHYTVFLPHWLLLLAVSIPWSALLLWRARRRKRISMP